MIKFLPLTLFAFFTSSLLAIDRLPEKDDKKYLCIAEEVTGFKLGDKKKWVSSRFEVGEKYILREIKKAEAGYRAEQTTFGLYKFSSNYPSYRCEDKNSAGTYLCFMNASKHLGTFNFSPSTGRFLLTYNGGYWVPEDNPYYKHTPTMTIGACAEL